MPSRAVEQRAWLTQGELSKATYSVDVRRDGVATLSHNGAGWHNGAEGHNGAGGNGRSRQR